MPIELTSRDQNYNDVVPRANYWHGTLSHFDPRKRKTGRTSWPRLTAKIERKYVHYFPFLSSACIRTYACTSERVKFLRLAHSVDVEEGGKMGILTRNKMEWLLSFRPERFTPPDWSALQTRKPGRARCSECARKPSAAFANEKGVVFNEQKLPLKLAREERIKLGCWVTKPNHGLTFNSRLKIKQQRKDYILGGRRKNNRILKRPTHVN